MTGEDGVQPNFRNWKYLMSEFWVCNFCLFFVIASFWFYCTAVFTEEGLRLIFIHISPRHILHVPVQIQSGSYNKLVIIRPLYNIFFLCHGDYNGPLCILFLNVEGRTIANISFYKIVPIFYSFACITHLLFHVILISKHPRISKVKQLSINTT